MNYLKRFKLWEWLLFAAVMLLSGIVYELHNAPGRYIPIGMDEYSMIDTRTGAVYNRNQNTEEWDIWTKKLNW